MDTSLPHESLWESVLSYNVDSRDPVQVIRLSSWCLYLLNHPSASLFYFSPDSWLASKSQQSFCLPHPSFEIGVMINPTKLLKFEFFYLRSSYLHNNCSYPLSHLPSPRPETLLKTETVPCLPQIQCQTQRLACRRFPQHFHEVSKWVNKHLAQNWDSSPAPFASTPLHSDGTGTVLCVI